MTLDKELLEMVLVACSTLPLSAQLPGHHPNPQFLDQSIAPVVRLRQNGPARTAPFVFAAQPAVSIGSEDDPDSLLIGEITGVAVNSRGEILILDAKSNVVRVYGENGKSIGRVGRYEHGPGELSNLHAIALGPDDRNDDQSATDATMMLTTMMGSASRATP